MEVVSIAEIFRISQRKYQPNADRRQLKTIGKETEKKLKEDKEFKKMMLLDKAVSYLGAEPKQPLFTEEEHFGMLIAKTLTLNQV